MFCNCKSSGIWLVPVARGHWRTSWFLESTSPVPSVKPVNINDASEPETSLLMVQKEQLWQKHTGNGALHWPHAELQPAPHFFPCSYASIWGQAWAQIRNVTKWCFRDCCAAMPTLGNQPLGAHVGYLEDSVQERQTKCLGTFLLETRSWGADLELSFHGSPAQASSLVTHLQHTWSLWGSPRLQQVPSSSLSD